MSVFPPASCREEKGRTRCACAKRRRDSDSSSCSSSWNLNYEGQVGRGWWRPTTTTIALVQYVKLSQHDDRLHHTSKQSVEYLQLLRGQWRRRLAPTSRRYPHTHTQGCNRSTDFFVITWTSGHSSRVKQPLLAGQKRPYLVGLGGVCGHNWVGSIWPYLGRVLMAIIVEAVTRFCISSSHLGICLVTRWCAGGWDSAIIEMQSVKG